MLFYSYRTRTESYTAHESQPTVFFRLMKLKQLEIALQDLNGFDKPNVKLEQYETTPHLAGQYQ